MYFKRKIENNTINARETCKIINKLLVRNSKTELPDKFIVRNEMVTDPLLKGLLDYAIKIVATWVARKKLHARIARPFTLRIQHRAIIIKKFQWLDFQQRFGDCVPICDCVSKIWHCILNKFYEIYTQFIIFEQWFIKRVVHISVKVFWTFTSNEETYFLL